MVDLIWQIASRANRLLLAGLVIERVALGERRYVDRAAFWTFEF